MKSDVKVPTRSRPQEENLKSLTKAAAILNCFSTDRRSLSLAEICATLDYPRSTTHRFLASMREVGLLDQDGNAATTASASACSSSATRYWPISICTARRRRSSRRCSV